MTQAERSESARRAVLARWAKAKGVSASHSKAAKKRLKGLPPAPAAAPPENSDQALRLVLRQLRAATARAEISRLTERLERILFHKQLTSA